MIPAYSTIEASIDGGIGHIRLNRPKALNAINSPMIAEITEALALLNKEPEVRVIVLSANGKSFSAGFDLKESAEKNYTTTADFKGAIEADFDFIMQFWDSKKPTISAIQGYCIAGGMELALACDISVASEDAIFGEPEVRFGSGIVAMIVPWLTGPKFAKEILLTGNDRIPASRALSMGLVNEVVPAGQQLDRAFALAGDIIAASAISVELTKRAINRSFDIRGMRQSLLAAVDADIIIESLAGPERKEFNRIRKEEGLKAAIAWRDSRFRKPT
ncbi:MAG: enoyl-CoA hydratase/isomerase family protein [Mesorhizobium sp.]|nr:enoyl-CoA hydratase/isomerase family protein [Mesorhizobium sp.]MBL8575585.1 enoyl-CoA hydratase/isomerase family protein [Mesorhizobium sp.]